VLPVQTSNPATVAGTYRLDQPGLGRREQLREHSNIVTARGREAERRVHVDADYVPARREPQLALAGAQHIPGFVFLPADQGMLAVGAEPSVCSRLTAGARQPVVAAGPTVFGPSARLEVPAAEGPDNDMDASR
jgi:hypothetical protein